MLLYRRINRTGSLGYRPKWAARPLPSIVVYVVFYSSVPNRRTLVTNVFGHRFYSVKVNKQTQIRKKCEPFLTQFYVASSY
jgi:hypothetical protein